MIIELISRPVSLVVEAPGSFGSDAAADVVVGNAGGCPDGRAEAERTCEGCQTNESAFTRQDLASECSNPRILDIHRREIRTSCREMLFLGVCHRERLYHANRRKTTIRRRNIGKKIAKRRETLMAWIKELERLQNQKRTHRVCDPAILAAAQSSSRARARRKRVSMKTFSNPMSPTSCDRTRRVAER